MNSQRAYIVVPTNRPERIQRFCTAWDVAASPDDIRWIIVEDALTKTLTLPGNVLHLSHAEIDRYERVAHLIPRRSGGIRSIGFWIAGHDPECDIVISLDDDCYPTTEEVERLAAPPVCEFVEEHRLSLDAEHTARWWPTVGTRVRGFPYSGLRQRAVVNHGLWHNVPDLDAVTQLQNPEAIKEYATITPDAWDSRPIPHGYYFPFCIMNVAARREWAPLLYMPPLPDGMQRWDDMWAGLILKRIADAMGEVVTNGAPYIWHDRASDPLANLRREFLGYGIHEQLWGIIDRCTVWKASMAHAYQSIAHEIGLAFPLLREATDKMEDWAAAWIEQPG